MERDCLSQYRDDKIQHPGNKCTFASKTNKKFEEIDGKK